MDVTLPSIYFFFWKPTFPRAAKAPLVVLGLQSGQKVQPAASKGVSPTAGEPPPAALGAPHQAAGKVSQGRRSKKGQKIKDGRDGGASPVSHPGTFTW